MADLRRLLASLAATYRTYALLGAAGLVGAAGVSWARAVLVMIAVALGGCAALPSQVERPVSQARTDLAGTTLAKIAAASTPAEQRELSGFRLLPDASQAFDARLALIRRAEKTIDVQYYQIADDPTGLQFLRALRDAAARGVRVRILVDDLYAAGEDELFADLAAHDNVELRLFNPLPVRGGSFTERLVLSLHELSRINRRMHNKTFIADNAFAIVGGRNIADEYFGRSKPADFIDMDVLASGPVVRELSAVFDRYWNCEHGYPVQSLAGAAGDTASRQRRFDAAAANLPADEPPVALDTLGQPDVAQQLAGGKLEQHFARARVVADSTKKADGDSAAADGAVTDATLDLIGSARSEVLVSSPYLVPGEHGFATLTSALARKVRVSLMTNSLATTDEPLVHAGYARYRAKLLAMGVRLFELMPTDEAAGPKTEFHGSLGRLHAKLVVVDERRLFIGSMNMDRRSARLNTEVGLVIDSPELAGEVAGLLKRDRLPASYRLRMAGDTGTIEWISGPSGNETVRTSEPGATPARLLQLSLTSTLVGEDML